MRDGVILSNAVSHWLGAGLESALYMNNGPRDLLKGQQWIIFDIHSLASAEHQGPILLIVTS